MTEEYVYDIVANCKIPNFFITAEIICSNTNIPTDISLFLKMKGKAIQQGISGRRFVYKANGWRIIFTFFPTNKVVEERYALKNKVLSRFNVPK